MSVNLDKRAIAKLEQELANNFYLACQETVPFIQGLTPVDTKRLYNSTRVREPIKTGKVINCDFVAGGVALPGEIREQDLVREVDYAYFVEIKQSYIRSNLIEIGNEVVENYQDI